MNEIKIEDKTIGENSPVFLIAEAGINHNGDILLAKKMIDKASEAKVDAIKFQTYKTDKLILKNTPKADYQKISKDSDEDFYEMIKKYEFSDEIFEDLKNYCSYKNLIFLSTPFDDNSVELLDKLNVPVFKIGSGDMNNFPLLKLICSKNKPIFLSTGMATLNEVKLSVGFLRSNNIDEIVIFQCTSSYPAAYEDVNLNVIDTFKQEFPDLLIGFSDHSLGIEASVGAVAKGVKVVEKHFTLDKNMEGPDHKSSLDPIELNQWVLSIRNLEKALGGYDKKPSNIELEISKVARKSVVSIKEIRKGEILTKEKIAIKRPGYGISPINLEKIIGMKVKRDISKDSIIYWEDIE